MILAVVLAVDHNRHRHPLDNFHTDMMNTVDGVDTDAARVANR